VSYRHVSTNEAEHLLCRRSSPTTSTNAIVGRPPIATVWTKIVLAGEGAPRISLGSSRRSPDSRLIGQAHPSHALDARSTSRGVLGALGASPRRLQHAFSLRHPRLISWTCRLLQPQCNSIIVARRTASGKRILTTASAVLCRGRRDSRHHVLHASVFGVPRSLSTPTSATSVLYKPLTAITQD